MPIRAEKFNDGAALLEKKAKAKRPVIVDAAKLVALLEKAWLIEKHVDTTNLGSDQVVRFSNCIDDVVESVE